MKISNKAKALAEKTSDAYSAGNYNSWAAVANMLLSRGYTEREAEAIMRSKWTRWAGDGSRNHYGRYTAKDLERFMDTPGNRVTPFEVMKLVNETFTD